MPRDRGVRLAQGVEQPDHIADHVQKSVPLDRLGPVSPTEAAHVGRHRAEAGLRQSTELMAPRVPTLGKPVAQQHEGPGALLRDVHPDAVRLYEAVHRPCHRRLLHHSGRPAPPDKGSHSRPGFRNTPATRSWEWRGGLTKLNLVSFLLRCAGFISRPLPGYQP